MFKYGKLEIRKWFFSGQDIKILSLFYSKSCKNCFLIEAFPLLESSKNDVFTRYLIKKKASFKDDFIL